MKKTFSLLLVLCIILSLFACKKTDPDVQKSTEPDSAPNELPDMEVNQRPMITVSLPSITETTTAADGTEIFHYVYPGMELVFPDAAVAQKVLNQHRSRLLEHLESVEEMRLAAERDYRPGEPFVPYLYSLTYNPMRMDQNVISFFGNCATYMGGVHPDHHGFGVNYDMVTGEVLTLGSILSHVDNKEALKALLINELDQIAQEKYLSGYKEYVDIRFKKHESEDEAWFFTHTGLCFFFSPYEIAPYSQGTIVVEIPYASLTGIIADEFFPGERMPSSGTITEAAFADCDLTQFTQTTEVILEPDSPKTIYYTDSAILDFRILQVNPVTGYESTVFAAPYLTPGDAVLLEISEAAKQTLTVFYINAGKEIVITY